MTNETGFQGRTRILDHPPFPINSFNSHFMEFISVDSINKEVWASQLHWNIRRVNRHCFGTKFTAMILLNKMSTPLSITGGQVSWMNGWVGLRKITRNRGLIFGP